MELMEWFRWFGKAKKSTAVSDHSYDAVYEATFTPKQRGSIAGLDNAALLCNEWGNCLRATGFWAHLSCSKNSG
jgi:hypothetical protein